MLNGFWVAFLIYFNDLSFIVSKFKITFVLERLVLENTEWTETTMAAKPSLLRELNQLPDAALEEVASLIRRLKKCPDKQLSPKHNGRALAARQSEAIKKWAGSNLGDGYTGRDHDSVLYGGKG